MTETEILEVLSEGEADRLAELEQKIARGQRTFREVGEALFVIQQARLYRASHATFVAYLKARWDWSESRGYEMIDAFQAVDALESDDRTSAMAEVPNVRVARVLAPLKKDPAQVAAAWAKVVEQHEQGNGPITASEAKRVLVKEGFIPDTAGAGGKPGWHELLGIVGDDLLKAMKDLRKVDDALTRRPNKKFRDNATKYADWADALEGTLRRMAE